MYIQAGLYSYILKQNLEKDEYFKDFKVEDFLFIVISRYTMKPVVWSWDKTQYTEDFDIEISTGRNIRINGWGRLTRELQYYLDKKPEYPLNVKPLFSNSIYSAIQEW